MRLYEMAAGTVTYPDGRTSHTGTVVIVRLADSPTADPVLPAELRRPDGTTWPDGRVATDLNGKVVVAWPGDGPYPALLWADTGRGRFPMLPLDLSARLAALEAIVLGGYTPPDPEPSSGYQATYPATY